MSFKNVVVNALSVMDFHFTGYPNPQRSQSTNEAGQHLYEDADGNIVTMDMTIEFDDETGGLKSKVENKPIFDKNPDGTYKLSYGYGHVRYFGVNDETGEQHQQPISRSVSELTDEQKTALLQILLPDRAALAAELGVKMWPKDDDGNKE